MGEGTCLLKEAERRACVFELREHLGGAVGADQKVRFLAVGQKLVKRGLLLGTNENGVAYAVLRLRGGQQRTERFAAQHTEQRVVGAFQRGGGILAAVRDGEPDGMTGGIEAAHKLRERFDLVSGQEERRALPGALQRGSGGLRFL